MRVRAAVRQGPAGRLCWNSRRLVWKAIGVPAINRFLSADRRDAGMRPAVPAPADPVALEVSTHKLFAPTAYRGAIPRSVVLERLFADPALRLLVLQAPAGHGKSTLLQQAKAICEADGARTAWLSFDEADNDLRRCALHLQALLTAALDDDTGADFDPSAGLVGSAPRRRSDWFIHRLSRRTQPVCLFLDEFQTLASAPILAFFRELFDRIPDHVRIFIGSRSLPDVGLVRQVVNQRARVLSADDLRFSPAEVAQFFAGSPGIGVSSEEVDAIYQRTEGWPAALQLFRLSLDSPSVRRALRGSGSFRPRELAEYLAENVLALQPQDIQDFLLRTALLHRLSAPLCEVVTGRADAQEVLLRLERSGLFLRSLDSEQQWFRYHGLFSSCLAERLRETDAAAVLDVHRRAAAWYRAHGHNEDAIAHAMAVDDFAFAADVLNQHASHLVADGCLVTTERLAERIPLDEIARRPDLVIKLAYVYVFLRRHAKLEPLLGLLQALRNGGDVRRTTNPDPVLSMAAIMHDDPVAAFALAGGIEVHVDRPEGFCAFELGAVANVNAYSLQASGHFERARELLALAQAYSQRSGARFSGGYTVAVSVINLLVQGALRAAIDQSNAALAEQKSELETSMASASLVACHVHALYHAGRLDDAEALFTQHHDTIADAVLLEFLAVAYLAMVRIHQARGRGNQAADLLDEMERIAHANNWPRLLRIAQWERVRLTLLHGDTAAAAAMAARIPAERPNRLPSTVVLFAEDSEGDAVGQIRLAIHHGDADGALRMLLRELAQAQNQRRNHRQIKLGVLEALAHERCGHRNAARRSLLRALQLAAPGGYVSSFLEEGPAVVAMLHDELATLERGTDGSHADAVAHLRHILGMPGVAAAIPGVLDTPAGPVEALTDRERQILVFLTNGVSNREMATRIFVSENTVKYHLKNIFAKLGVGSRLQAINAARQLGLIG